MTILEASNLIYKFLGENDEIILSRDFNKLILISSDKEKDEAILRLALKSFEKMEILESCLISVKNSKNALVGDTLWVLKRPITAYPQDVKISYPLCQQIAEFTNLYCEKFDFKGSMVDAKQITEKNIENLLSIGMVLLNMVIEKNKE